MNSLLFGLLLFLPNVEFDLESKIKQLKPEINEYTMEIVKNTIENKSALYGFTQNDYPLIISMMKKESNFAHIFGEHGEIGMLQVIPEDGHIMKIVSNIVCIKTEKYCLETGSPDVWTNNKINSFKVRRFLTLHKHYAIETGFGEMKYWKEEYVRTLKNKYWTKFPEWYLKNKLSNYLKREKSLRWWWNNLVDKVGDEYIWISHYNWGSQMATSSASRNYALSVINIMSSL